MGKRNVLRSLWITPMCLALTMVLGTLDAVQSSTTKAEKEAEKVTKDYENRVKEIKNTSEDKIKEAVDYILSEVLPE